MNPFFVVERSKAHNLDRSVTQHIYLSKAVVKLIAISIYKGTMYTKCLQGHDLHDTPCTIQYTIFIVATLSSMKQRSTRPSYFNDSLMEKVVDSMKNTIRTRGSSHYVYHIESSMYKETGSHTPFSAPVIFLIIRWLPYSYSIRGEMDNYYGSLTCST